MKNYQIFYRRQGYPNASIYCKTIRAFDIETAEMLAYSEINENYTIVDIIAE